VEKRQVLSWRRLKVGNYLFIRSPTVGVVGIFKIVYPSYCLAARIVSAISTTLGQFFVLLNQNEIIP